MNLKPCYALAGSALLQLLSASIYAQIAPTPQPMDTVVVTATGSEQRISDTILDTTVITQKDIQDSQAVDVPSLLRREAGFEIVQSGGIGSQSSVFMRGTNSTHTLVLIDGVRLSSATTGTTALDQIMLDEVERIEIVRGNVSAVYGSEAIGGVIQIFTKRGHSAPALSASAGAGNRNTNRVSGNYGGVIGDIQFNVTVSEFSTSGFPAIKPSVAPFSVNPDNDGYRNTSLSANITQRFGPQVRAGLTAYVSDGHLGFADAFAFSPNDTNSAHNQVASYSGFVEYEPTNIWTTKLTLARGQDHSQDFLNDVLSSKFNTDTDQANWQNDFRFAPGQLVIAGVEQRRQSVSSTTDYTQSSRNIASYFAGYTGEFGDNSLQANVRNEHYSDFGNATTYLAGYGYKLTPAWRLSAAASSAFRAPTFNELYYPEFGTPTLQPERATSGEIGIQYAVGQQLAKLVAFRTRIRDLIDGFPLANISRAEITGAELSYRGVIYGFDIIASVTAQNPVDQSDGMSTQLLRRAKDFASLTVQKSIGAWRLGGEIRGSSLRYDDNIVAFPTVVDTLGGYAVVNLLAKYQVNKNISVQARLENAFNRDYEVADGYNTPPRTYFVGISYQP
jgi:vitamin B12 transporter